MLSMLPLCLAIMPVSCGFVKSLFSPRSCNNYKTVRGKMSDTVNH